MNRFKYLGAAFALTLATSAFAMGDCCCKDKDGKKAECCEKKHDGKAAGHGDHADHGKADAKPK